MNMANILLILAAPILGISCSENVSIHSTAAAAAEEISVPKENIEYSQILGDFDGNSSIDKAFLIPLAAGGVSLNVTLTGKTNEILQVFTTVSQDNVELLLLDPGTHPTPCAKGYGKSCESEEEKSFTVPNKSIIFHVKESASIAFYFDGRNWENIFLTD